MGNSSHRAFMPFSFKEANKEGEEAKSHFFWYYQLENMSDS